MLSILCTMYLNVNFSDGSTLEFGVSRDTLIRTIIRSCKERSGIKDDLCLYHGTKMLGEYKTVSQCNLQHGDQLIVKIMSQESLLLNYVNIIVRHDNLDIHYKVPKRNTLNNLILHYNEKYESDRLLWFGSYQINGTEKISDLGLKNNDILIAN